LAANSLFATSRESAVPSRTGILSARLHAVCKQVTYRSFHHYAPAQGPAL